ncbi:MAG: helicase-related protein [Rhodospirillales bacterium]|nr:helicase-related protein [Rhodospirillales bacterium]MCW9001516.1 helicase-related protein [Rhodospirillales bacterium]
MQINTSAQRPEGSRLVAVLGPTNTGKTYLAIERMLAHESGMIGFPLRLLARENYDRVVKAKGAAQVALITGEEKIVPPTARYFLCTAESMPVDRRVAFVGLDEVQMAADPDRGHIFTERLLSARGTQETMFMGSDTARGLITRLVEGVEIMRRPRFSTLRHTGARKVTRLPPRCAIVAFSASDVYSLAELVRRQRGGAAVVLGALSPRTRNAQVGMFQAGEVDYLVATDAIGMGLNMDIDHVAFAALRKFDGRHPRILMPAELAQIAGRAGRHMNDGTFGTTAEAGDLDAEVVERLENHQFKPLQVLQWRNTDLTFTSIEALKASLARQPDRDGLVRAREADDQMALEILTKDDRIAGLATGPDAVALLWEVCRIPDFGKVRVEAHAGLLARVFNHLMADGGRLPTDWVAGQVKRLERTDGDIETIAQRIAGIRTWTYVSHRAGWVDDPAHWQEKTRTVEDQLSDALHERLTQRFVDQRTSVLVRRMKKEQDLSAFVSGDGGVNVEGHFVGRLEGFSFKADRGENRRADRAVAGAAQKALQGEVKSRLGAIERAGGDAIVLDPGGRLFWEGAEIARLVRGATAASPRVALLASDLLDDAARAALQARLEGWIGDRIATVLAPLRRLEEMTLEGAARGLVFQLVEAMGAVPRDQVAEQIDALSRADRKALREGGARIGRAAVWLPGLIKPAAAGLCALLWAVHRQLDPIPASPPPGRVSLIQEPDVPEGFWRAGGYWPVGGRLLRIDMLERIASAAYALSRAGRFAISEELLSLAGATRPEMASILGGLGYGREEKEGVEMFRWRGRFIRPKAAKGRKPGKGEKGAATSRPEQKARSKPKIRKEAKTAHDRSPRLREDESPFARLRELKFGK